MSSTNLERRRAVIKKRLTRGKTDEATDIKKWKVELERQRQRTEHRFCAPGSQLQCSEVRCTALPLDWFGGAPPCYVLSAEDQAKERMLVAQKEVDDIKKRATDRTAALMAWALAAIQAERSRQQKEVDDIKKRATDRTTALEAALEAAKRTIAATNMCGCACTFCGMCVCVYVCVSVLLALPLHRALCARVCEYILCVCAYVYVCVLWYVRACAFSSVNLSSGQGEYAGLSQGLRRTEKHTQTQRALTGVRLPSYTHTHKRLKQHKNKTRTNTKHTNTQTNTQTHKHTHTHKHKTHKHANTQTNTRTHKHTNTQTRTHTERTHTHTHTENTHSHTHSLLCTLSGEHRGKVRGRRCVQCSHVASRCHCGLS